MSLLNIEVKNDFIPPQKKDIEIIERKGIGHPDTLADGIAESASIAYSLYCLDNFGAILHHNLDKVYIGGGKINIDFGYGEIVKPVIVDFNGRLSKSFGDKEIDYKEILKGATLEHLEKSLPYMDIDKGLEFRFSTTDHSVKSFWFSPRDVKDIPDFYDPVSNDTSTCIGFWPLSPMELAVLKLEEFFYNENESPKFNFVGQDIKVMGIRMKDEANFVVTMPFIATETPNSSFYKEVINEFQEKLTAIARETVGSIYHSNVFLNNERGYYLLLGGSCVELGEEGLVGRGNKTSGIIPIMRPCSMEAPYGKNPIYHVGKVYAVIVDSLSKEISRKFDCSSNVSIITRIGDDLYNPYRVFVEVDRKVNSKDIQETIEQTIEQTPWTDKILKERILIPRVGTYNSI